MVLGVFGWFGGVFRFLDGFLDGLGCLGCF